MRRCEPKNVLVVFHCLTGVDEDTVSDGYVSLARAQPATGRTVASQEHLKWRMSWSGM